MERQDSFTRRQAIALVLLGAASFLAVLDATIVSIALPSMSAALGFSPEGAQWILNAYGLAFGGLLLLFGRLADLRGRRLVFLTGLGCFAAASLLAGFAWEPWVLVGARVAQGIAAAAFAPVSLSLVAASFPDGPLRNRALGVQGAMAAIGFVVGMVVGGVITELLGWRWVFFVNVPVVAAVLLLVPFFVAESRADEEGQPLDWPGAVVLTMALTALLVGVAAVPEHGWLAPRSLGVGALGVALVLALVAIERRAPAPLLPVDLLTSRRVVAPSVAMLLQSMIGVAQLYVLTFYFQDARGLSPLATGFAFLPMTIASIFGAWLGGRLATGAGIKRASFLGMALLGFGLLLMSALSVNGRLVVVIAGMVIGEIGFMMASVALTIAIAGAVEEQRQGLVAGLRDTAIQLGNALGLGVIVSIAAVVTAALADDAPSAADYVAGLRWGLWAGVAIAALAALTVLAFVGDADHRPVTGAERNVSRRSGRSHLVES